MICYREDECSNSESKPSCVNYMICYCEDECSNSESEPSCVNGFQHTYTSQGCGGLKENPGVWLIGGTAYRFKTRCIVCGVRKHLVDYGSQRNAGKCDYVQYFSGPTNIEEAVTEKRRQRRNAQARARYAKRKKAGATCKVCKGTHRFDNGWPCTACPLPCRLCCNSSVPYCTVTPCSCSCHSATRK
jgi:hypothetical protein